MVCVEFRYSGVYDRSFGRELLGFEKACAYIDKLEKKWCVSEEKIFSAMSEATGLSWNESKIIVYINNVRAFSDPLTIPVFDDLDVGYDVLIHELIHQLYIQNRDKMKEVNYWNMVSQKYPDELPLTRNHIHLHALFQHIMIDILKEPQRLEREFEALKNPQRAERAKPYQRAWDIVTEKGYEIILSEFKQSFS